MDKICQQLKENRPNLSASSIKTYCSTLINIYGNVFGNTNDMIMSWFNKTKPILDYLSDKPPSRRKSALSALFVFTGVKEYQTEMNKDLSIHNENIQTQKKNDKEEAYWLSRDELMKIYNDKKKIAVKLFRQKEYSKDDLQKIQDYIILSLYILTQPRRSLDYTEMVIKNPNKETDNYVEGNSFVFNTYKTSKFYGQQIEKIPLPLKKIIDKWIIINPTNYLLFNSKGNKLTSVSLTQKLNKIFGNNISVNALRHLYISHKYSSFIDKNKDMEQDLKAMGSSIAQEKVYNKE